MAQRLSDAFHYVARSEINVGNKPHLSVSKANQRERELAIELTLLKGELKTSTELCEHYKAQCEILEKSETTLLLSIARLRDENFLLKQSEGWKGEPKKQVGRPQSRRKRNRRGLPRIWFGKGGLTETGVITVKLLFKTGMFTQADLCHMLFLTRSTCSRILQRPEGDERLKKLAHTRTTLQSWSGYENAKNFPKYRLLSTRKEHLLIFVAQ